MKDQNKKNYKFQKIKSQRKKPKNLKQDAKKNNSNKRERKSNKIWSSDIVGI